MNYNNQNQVSQSQGYGNPGSLNKLPKYGNNSSMSDQNNGTGKIRRKRDFSQVVDP